ncbi:hypothetical protein CMUS01_09283 [Colletotrichum musicola]|uniref:Uncharacterized protein n=1 Tax=Colletotrichum musicola TaxID=2175873 RepID=A0A8H6K8P1_9PEZI|nr:hypothetical protein CMUS01_09283 [Colletotrichum musicola]
MAERWHLTVSIIKTHRLEPPRTVTRTHHHADLDVRPLAAKPSRSAQPEPSGLAKRVWRTADSETGMGRIDLGLQTGRQEADITPDDYGTPWPSDRNHDLAGPDLVTHAPPPPPNPVPASSPAPNPTAGHQRDGRLAAVGPGQHEASGGTTTTTNAWYTSLGWSLRPRPRPPVNTTADMDKTNKQPRRQGGVQACRKAGRTRAAGSVYAPGRSSMLTTRMHVAARPTERRHREDPIKPDGTNLRAASLNLVGRPKRNARRCYKTLFLPPPLCPAIDGWKGGIDDGDMQKKKDLIPRSLLPDIPRSTVRFFE